MPPEAAGPLDGDKSLPFFVHMHASFDVYSLGIVAHQLLTGSPLPATSGEVGAVEASSWHGKGCDIRKRLMTLSVDAPKFRTLRLHTLILCA